MQVHTFALPSSTGAPGSSGLSQTGTGETRGYGVWGVAKIFKFYASCSVSGKGDHDFVTAAGASN